MPMAPADLAERVAAVESFQSGDPPGDGVDAAAPEGADEAEAKAAEDEDGGEDEGEGEGEGEPAKKLSGHQRQKAKIKKLEAELASNTQLLQKFHAEAMGVLQDNDNLIAERDALRHEVAALRKMASEYGLDPESAVDPKELEVMDLRRKLSKSEAAEKARLEAAKAAQLDAVKNEIRTVAEKYKVPWRAVAKGVLVLQGQSTPEEVAAMLASGPQAREKAAGRVGRPGQKTHLNADSRSAASGDTYEDRVAFVEGRQG